MVFFLKKIFLVLGLCCFIPSQAFSGEWWLFASVGTGDCKSAVIDMTLRKTFDCIYENDMFFLYPLAEVSLHYWRHSSDADDFGGTLAGGGAAVFKRKGMWRPYLSATFGGSLLSDTRFYDKNFGMSFQFRSKAGAGIQFGENFRHSVQFDFAHFSNAGISDHNSGINTYCVSYGFRF